MPWRGSAGKTRVGHVERVVTGYPSEAIDHSKSLRETAVIGDAFWSIHRGTWVSTGITRAYIRMCMRYARATINGKGRQNVKHAWEWPAAGDALAFSVGKFSTEHDLISYKIDIFSRIIKHG